MILNFIFLPSKCIFNINILTRLRIDTISVVILNHDGVPPINRKSRKKTIIPLCVREYIKIFHRNIADLKWINTCVHVCKWNWLNFGFGNLQLCFVTLIISNGTRIDYIEFVAKCLRKWTACDAIWRQTGAWAHIIAKKFWIASGSHNQNQMHAPLRVKNTRTKWQTFALWYQKGKLVPTCLLFMIVIRSVSKCHAIIAPWRVNSKQCAKIRMKTGV